MKEYAFYAIPGDDDEIIDALDALTADEQNDLLRKAIALYLKPQASQGLKSKRPKRSIRPEPHGYPVE